MNRNVVLVVIAGVAVGGLAAYMLSTGGLLGSEDQQTPPTDSFSPVLWDLQTQEDFVQSHQQMLAANLSEDRLQVGAYGKWRESSPFFETSVLYRTKWISVNDPIQLDTLRANGYIGSGPTAGLRVIIRTCDRIPEQGPEYAQYCHSENPTYSSGVITEPGSVSLEEDLSSITTSQNLMLELSVYTNTTTPVPEDQRTYWDSVRVTAQKLE